jgi:hypothetical protein
MRYNRNPLNKLMKTLPLLKSRDVSDVLNGLQLLDTMMDIFPNEVEQVWDKLHRYDKQNLWAMYIKNHYLGDRKYIVNVDIYTDGRLMVNVNKYVKDGKSFTLFLSFEDEKPRQLTGTNVYISVPTETFEKKLIYKQFYKNRIEEYSTQLLGLDMSSFDPSSFVDVMKVLNSRFARDAFSKYIAATT